MAKYLNSDQSMFAIAQPSNFSALFYSLDHPELVEGCIFFHQGEKETSAL